jgi:hypothetical protein
MNTTKYRINGTYVIRIPHDMAVQYHINTAKKIDLIENENQTLTIKVII